MFDVFKTNILVRDKMIEKMEGDGILVDYKTLNQNEYITALRNKVIEEAQEVAEEKDKGKLIYEFADLLEVMETLASAVGVSVEEIKTAQREKSQRFGRYSKGYFTNSLKIDTKNPAIEYYRKRPIKYPKIQTEK